MYRAKGIKMGFKVECYHENCNALSREFTNAEYDRLYSRQNKQYQCVTCSSKNNIRKANPDKHSNPEEYNQRQDQKSRIMSEWHKNNPKKSSEIAKKRRKKVQTSGTELVKKAYQTIKNDPVKYQKYCEKRRQIALDYHQSLTDEQKETHYQKVFANNSPSRESQDFLNEVEIQLNITLSKEKFINGFLVDGVIGNIIIEYFGSTFHCSPLIYKDPNQYCSWIQRTVQEQWDRDKKRLAVFHKNCYNVIVVWDYEWKQNPQLVIKRIQNALCKS